MTHDYKLTRLRLERPSGQLLCERTVTTVGPAALRAQIRSGVLRGAALLQLLDAVPQRQRDVWVDELLGFEEAPADIDALPRGAVPYLPAGVEEILTMVREVPLRADDVLVDLGSGVGRVAILAHLLSGARAGGIELQEPLVRVAQERVRALALSDVSFVRADLSEAELEGSVFFLYAPCNGETLIRVLKALETVARRKSITICAVDLELRENWLVPRKTSSASLTLYDSCVAPP